MTHESGQVPSAIRLGNFQILLDGSDIRTARPSDTVEDAETTMDEGTGDGYPIDQVPVVDPKSELRVLTRRMISLVPPIDRTATRVSDVPGIEDLPPTLPAVTRLSDACQDLIDQDWVITTDGHGEPIGLATVGDALKAVMATFDV